MFYNLYMKKIMEIIYKGMEETVFFFFLFFEKQTHPLLVLADPNSLSVSWFIWKFLVLLACTVKKQKKDRKKTPCILPGYLL